MKRTIYASIFAGCALLAALASLAFGQARITPTTGVHFADPWTTVQSALMDLGSRQVRAESVISQQQGVIRQQQTAIAALQKDLAVQKKRISQLERRGQPIRRPAVQAKR